MMTRIYLVFVLAHRIKNKVTYCPHIMGIQEGTELDTVLEYLFGKDDEAEEDYFLMESPHARLFSSESSALKIYATLVEGYLECGTLRYEDYAICGEPSIEIIM